MQWIYRQENQGDIDACKKIAWKVLKKCWEEKAVDLVGPMSSSKHTVAVQDLTSRFSLLKLVSSTSADKVIPALANIYETYENPNLQLSDNGPLFNSKKMSEFAK